MTTNPAALRAEFLDKASSFKCIAYELKHRLACPQIVGTTKTGEPIFCNPCADDQFLVWKGREYLVAVPDCRYSYARQIIGTLEAFAEDVGWAATHGWRNDYGIIRGESELWSTLQTWFPHYHVDYFTQIGKYVARVCVPAAEAGWSRGPYYWTRDVARATKQFAIQRGRLRCAWCRRILTWKGYKEKFTEPNRWGERYSRPVYCESACEILHERDQRRIERQQRRDFKWLQKGKHTLREIRAMARQQAQGVRSRQRGGLRQDMISRTS